MNEFIGWFNQVLTISIQLYFQQECEYSSLEEVKPPVNGWLEKVTGVPDLTFDERMVVMLALMPHVCPQMTGHLFCTKQELRPAIYGIRWLERLVTWRFSANW